LPHPCPAAVERQTVRIHDDGQPVAGDRGARGRRPRRRAAVQNGGLTPTRSSTPCMAMRAALVVAVAANTITTKGGVA
jgi:hypothetical protein